MLLPLEGASNGRLNSESVIWPFPRYAPLWRPRGGGITTTKLIETLIDEFAPEGHDAQIIDGRNDTYFSQKVRNLVSHRASSTSMFAKGYATYHEESESIRITDLGRAFLDQVPDE